MIDDRIQQSVYFAATAGPDDDYEEFDDLEEEDDIDDLDVDEDIEEIDDLEDLTDLDDLADLDFDDEEEDYIEDEEYIEEDFEDEEFLEDEAYTEVEDPIFTDPDQLYELDDNPLNPTGDSLELLIQSDMNEDLWLMMMGDLPCLEPTSTCIGDLQATAVENNLTLQIINERVAAIEERIDEARALNQNAVFIDTIEPLANRYLQFEPTTGEGFLNNLLGIFTSPITSINEILSLIGIPLLRNTTRTNARAQANAIAIADLQVKVSQIEADARKIDQAIREEVLYQVLEFDVIRREFQISQEVAQRAVLQHRLLEIDYRFSPDRVSTDTYLNHLSSLDQQKAQTYRAWARLRTQLERIKILVLGVEN